MGGGTAEVWVGGREEIGGAACLLPTSETKVIEWIVLVMYLRPMIIIPLLLSTIARTCGPPCETVLYQQLLSIALSVHCAVAHLESLDLNYHCYYIAIDIHCFDYHINLFLGPCVCDVCVFAMFLE